MNVLDLFSGIGGFSLGLERAGMRTVAFCEIDPFCRRVLAKHWPDVPVWGDVRTLTAQWVMANAGSIERRQAIGFVQSEIMDEGGRNAAPSIAGSNNQIDIICGGFPCQDISVAGKGAGIEGSRSGLWGEYARVIGEVRPRYVIVENVAALLGRGLERVLGDLAAIGFDAEWHCIPASAVGAPHRRDRVWIVAHAAGAGWRSEGPAIAGKANGGRAFGEPRGTGEVAHASRQGSQGSLFGRKPITQTEVAFAGCSEEISNPDSARYGEGIRRAIGNGNRWATEPDVGRVAHGVPARVDRLRSLGNAVIPQIPEIIGRAIMNGENHVAR